MIETNVRSSDRKILLEPIEGKDPKGASGTADTRLFKGENFLHAKLDPQHMFWTLHFDKGVIPGAFQQNFTSFARALATVENYYSKRNVRVTQVID